MVNNQEFTERIKKILQHHQLTASLFADKIGVQRSSISHILCGTIQPRINERSTCWCSHCLMYILSLISLCTNKQKDYRSMRSNSILLHPLVELLPLTINLFCSLFLSCVFIMKAIIMNCSESWDVGIFYLSTKFELDQFTNNGDLFSDWNH